jgi:dTDP-4-amino-4,6-dideoxy-D-glucose acyltransferase
MSFLAPEELARLGLRHLGRNVRLSRHAVLHGAERIAIGDETRIDDFCVLSAGEGGIEIGAHVHLAVMVTLIGSAAIHIGDFAGLSSRTTVLSASDDFSGEWLTGPTVPEHLRRVEAAPVRIGRHVVVGAGCVILPGTEIGDGAALGALSLAKGQLAPFRIHAGTPARDLKPRSERLLELERELAAQSAAR